MTITKNSLPWTGLMKLPKPVKPEYLSLLQDLWKEQNWGVNFENYRRPTSQSAIYPCTRVVTYLPGINSPSEKFKNLSDVIASELQQFFTIPMKYWIAEIVLLTPNGFIPWHHDSLELCKRSSRIIIPLTPVDDIDYYFCSWHDDTPTGTERFSANSFLNTDIYQTKMSMGNYYFFNHRVPHKTLSKSKLPRATFSIDMIPESDYNEYLMKNSSTLVHGTISDFEKTKILPPIT
jgi:hypothetical protein